MWPLIILLVIPLGGKGGGQEGEGDSGAPQIGE